MHVIDKVAEKAPKIYIGFMMFLLLGTFLLNHSNQSSSQSVATIFLLCSPLLLLIKQHQSLPFGLKLFVTSCCAMFIYSLLIFFQFQISEVSYSTMRGLSFYLLAPFSILLVWNNPLKQRHLFMLFFTAAGFCLYPVIKEYYSNTPYMRGSSSAHSIFWGNVALTTGVVAFIISRNSQKTKLFGWLALSAAVTASLWSLTRGGWISIPLVLLMAAYMKVINKKQVATIFLAVIAMFMSSESLKNRVLDTFINRFTKEVYVDTSTSARLEMWETSLISFSENPTFGSGLDAFSKKSSETSILTNKTFHYEHPHNEYLEILSSRGLVGIAIFLLLISGMVSIYYKNRHSIYAKAGLIALMQYLIYSLSETFFTTKFTIMYFVVLHSFLLVAMYKEQQNQAQEPRVTAA